MSRTQDKWAGTEISPNIINKKFQNNNKGQ